MAHNPSSSKMTIWRQPLKLVETKYLPSDLWRGKHILREFLWGSLRNAGLTLRYGFLRIMYFMNLLKHYLCLGKCIIIYKIKYSHIHLFSLRLEGADCPYTVAIIMFPVLSVPGSGSQTEWQSHSMEESEQDISGLMLIRGL